MVYERAKNTVRHPIESPPLSPPRSLSLFLSLSPSLFPRLSHSLSVPLTLTPPPNPFSLRSFAPLLMQTQQCTRIRTCNNAHTQHARTIIHTHTHAQRTHTNEIHTHTHQYTLTHTQHTHTCTTHTHTQHTHTHTHTLAHCVKVWRSVWYRVLCARHSSTICPSMSWTPSPVVRAVPYRKWLPGLLPGALHLSCVSSLSLLSHTHTLSLSLALSHSRTHSLALSRTMSLSHSCALTYLYAEKQTHIKHIMYAKRCSCMCCTVRKW